MYLLAIVTLLLAAFFSGVEIAFISSNKLQLELQKTSGKYTGKIISFFSKTPSDFLTTMLIGNNIFLVTFGLIISQILTPQITKITEITFFVLLFQTIIVTIVILITAEFLPKTVFRIYSSKILKIFALPIALFFIILRPITKVILIFSDIVFKIFFGKTLNVDEVFFSRTDLDDYLNELNYVKDEDNNRVEVEMLKNALDLSETKLRECMIPRTELACMSINSTIPELRKKFISTKLSKILIFKNNIDNIIGYVHSSELFRNPKNIRATLLPIPFVPESMSALELLSQFIENNKGIAIVVDEFGGTSGLVTIEDITEEIVGDISDEHDKSQIEDVMIDDNKFRLLARSNVEEINKKYNLNLPDSEEYETIAGLILNHQENIPKINDEVSVHNFIFTITKVDKKTIQEVILEVK
ncbi:MAG: hemolysin [Candidatus Marinimicrobia bacterium]|nr:hemolysin [Candidatus Neomarinimicrobiota bacterium]